MPLVADVSAAVGSWEGASTLSRSTVLSSSEGDAVGSCEGASTLSRRTVLSNSEGDAVGSWEGASTLSRRTVLSNSEGDAVGSWEGAWRTVLSNSEGDAVGSWEGASTLSRRTVLSNSEGDAVGSWEGASTIAKRSPRYVDRADCDSTARPMSAASKYITKMPFKVSSCRYPYYVPYLKEAATQDGLKIFSFLNTAVT